MPTIDVQMLTLIEALVLLLSNGTGAVLALLAWRVSDVDVRTSGLRALDGIAAEDAIRIRHNRRVVTEDARYGESRRLECHVLIGLIGVFWIWVPQPTNPDVVLGAVAIRLVAVLVSLRLIDKTLHHLIARWRFDHPGRSAQLVVACWPALRLAWRDWRGAP